MTRAEAQRRIATELTGMPDEAFTWLVLAMRGPAATVRSARQVWPERLGGFQPASRAAIARVQAAVEAYLAATTSGQG